MAGGIAMLAVFLVTIVEMVFTKGLCGSNYSPDNHRDSTLEHGHSHNDDDDEYDSDDHGSKETEKGGVRAAQVEGAVGRGGAGVVVLVDGEPAVEAPPAAPERDDMGSRDSEQVGGSGGLGRLGFGIVGRRRSRSHSLGQGLQRFSHDMYEQAGRAKDTIAPVRDDDMRPVVAKEKPAATDLKALERERSKVQLTPQQKQKKATLQVFLLEMGIMFHSVFIGMAVSVSVGSPFIVLFIAIIFHQTFEGLALGSRIANLKWEEGGGSYKPWLMALAYGLTTPLGQAIGLGTHSLYSPQSPTGLLMVGIMNAISSGLLLFAGLVELLAEDFLSDESWHTLKGRRRIWAFLFVVAGAVGMAVVGAWA